jgi:hypothetical protein
VHCLEDVAAQRHSREKTERLDARRAVADYLKALVEGLRQ